MARLGQAISQSPVRIAFCFDQDGLGSLRGLYPDLIMNSYQTIDKRTSRRYKEPVHEWAQADTEEFKDEEFDFQGNLGLFDKARVFAEIRVSLSTDGFTCCDQNHYSFRREE